MRNHFSKHTAGAAIALAATLAWGAGAVADQGSGSAVIYYRAENVATSFAKGAVLHQEPGENYMIHTSRRVAPGMAEIHAKDTDLIYVLAGSATFVTGGRAIDGKTTAPGEIRGTSIEGGETRVLSKGDVIIVPNGTPHWFKEVQGPLLYYTIKVR